MKSVTFVCTANTCRSPMAQAIFSYWLCAQGVEDIQVKSAGLYSGGEQVNEIALSVLKKHGRNGALTNPKAIDDELYSRSDIIVTMTLEQARLLKERFGDDSKVKCIYDIIGSEVPDPYGQGAEAYERTFEILQNACHDIYDFIKK